MTTKFLDNKTCSFKILLSWRFPRKQAFLDDSPLCPPQKRKLYFYCRLAVSEPGAKTLFCPPFALFCELAFALFCGHLRSFVCFRVQPRLERPRLGTADLSIV